MTRTQLSFLCLEQHTLVQPDLYSFIGSSVTFFFKHTTKTGLNDKPFSKPPLDRFVANTSMAYETVVIENL